MPLATAREVVASAARTTTGNSGAIDLADALLTAHGEPDVDNIALVVRTTAVGGATPTMDLTIEWSVDGTNFVAADPADSFTQATTTATGSKAKRFTIKGTHYRVVWTLGGTTPSFTFSISEIAL